MNEPTAVSVQRDERPFFIFEMANNHMGDVEHGLRIIREIAEAAAPFSSAFQFGFKLQYRNLDTFIHPDYRENTEFKYIKRFKETRLSIGEFRRLKDEMVNQGFTAVCTPFDEASVDLIENHDFGAIKIASCSLTDWPLLERIAKTNKPLIGSAAGVSIEDTDRVVSFFDHRGKQFTLLHCVGEYPTPIGNLQLNQIDLFRERYPNTRIGFSTHEDPATVDSIKVAIAKGAKVFEKHVGVKTEQYSLNEYSATPEQIRRWLQAAKDAYEMVGVTGARSPFSIKELTALRSLRRGVFARRDIAPGEAISLENAFLAIPATSELQLTANDLSKYTDFQVEQPILAGEAVTFAATRHDSYREKVEAILLKIKDVIERSHVPVSRKLDFEISHHYGLDKFEQFGLTIINVVNREYCKKLLIMIPGQAHPEQHHKLKEETFHILHGNVSVTLDGVTREHGIGDVVTIERGINHAFSTKTGAVIEEISSTHYVNDSYYTDPSILTNGKRKTLITYWIR